MIEIPEAAVIACQISETLAGRRIVNTVANTTPHKFAWYNGNPADYRNRLAGRTIQGASASGGYIEIRADEMRLVISTPMKYHASGDVRPKKHQLLVEFDDHTAVSCTVQMWGAMICIPEAEEGGLPDYVIARHKPSPLTAAFDRVYFAGLVQQAGGGLSAKEFLATRQRIPGLGNGVLQDILWTARIHPRCRMGDLSAGEMGGMYHAVKAVLADMTAQGGRDTERDLFDVPGGYQTILSKNTVGAPCPVCGKIILKEPYLGGAIYFCAGCQALKN
jgi:formamidopyrimidine-DNA glycosylase